MARDKKTKASRRGAVIYTPIALLLIIVIAIFGISVFFRISAIEVIGAERYTVKQIISMSGIKTGDNLVFVDKNRATEEIRSNLPYLNEVVIEKIVPDTIRISVTESKPLAVIQYDGDWWIIDQKARVLDKTTAGDIEDKIKVNGLSVTAVSVGQEIRVDNSETTKRTYLIDVLSALENAGLSHQVQNLDISNIANISFDLSDRFNIEFGSGEDADYKIAIMNNIITQLDSEDTGRIDVSSDSEPRFIPD